MDQILSELTGRVDATTALCICLATVGIMYSAVQFFSNFRKVSKKATSTHLFPAVKKRGAELKGTVKCSLRSGVHFHEERLDSGDFNYNFSCQYMLGQDEEPIAAEHARPNMDIHSQYYQPAKKQKSNVQIFTPSMTPSRYQFFDPGLEPQYEFYDPSQNLDVINIWAQPDYAAVTTTDEPVEISTPFSEPPIERPVEMASEVAPLPHIPHAPVNQHMRHPGHPGAPGAPSSAHAGVTPVMVDNSPLVLDTPEPLAYPLLNDVLDVVYDDVYEKPVFGPVLSYGNQSIHSQTSSDHSDHEYFSPPYNYRGSPVSPESLGSPDSQLERFVCPHCSADFRIKGYLTRHLKKHARQKAYTCPFYDPESEHKCHPTGGFSRRDTYKTHLKARHFVYPKNTPCSKRSQVPGACSGCNQKFSSNEEWVESHIQTNKCASLRK